ncbi:hypothetical protein ACVWWR_002884 [Bradyrhizobium sp. LM3.2]
MAPERIAAAVSTADHCQAGPLGRRGADDLRGVAFLTGFVAAFANTLLRTVLVLPEVFAAFFAALFFLVAVFFATSRLLKLRRGSYGGHAPVYRRVSAWRAGAAEGARDTLMNL